MEQVERRIYLIKALLAERPERYEGMTIPQEPSRQRRLLRALLNVRPPEPVSGAFLRVQDAYLREELARKGVTDAEALPEPWDRPGYQDPVISAAGTFISGASIELSADAPIRPPYIAYLQLSLIHI